MNHMRGAIGPVSHGLQTASSIGVVVIGRNEGERLKRCLDSVLGLTDRVVYVDSGSSDGSVETAHSKRVEVAQLDVQTPFTPGRARNEGLRRLREVFPGLAYVQFVDGDCEIAAGWLKKAAIFLDIHHRVAAVCGRLRESHPERSIYNMLCDIEWDGPLGEVQESGGIVMVRICAFEAVQGFRSDLIAGEEPEFCVRLRASGWQIWRLDEDMALHDAAITRFSQWWMRSIRAGYAFAQGVALHGAPPERHKVRESRSAWFWGLGLPFLTSTSMAVIGPVGLVVLLAYPLQVVRLALHGSRSKRENWRRALFLVIGKIPEMFGQIQFLVHRHLGGVARLIEHK